VSLFEIVMLVCFGAAWPFAIVKSWRARRNDGKSLAFLVVVFTGYASGILHKLLYSRDPVIFLYALNLVMVGIDIALFARNRTPAYRAEPPSTRHSA